MLSLGLRLTLALWSLELAILVFRGTLVGDENGDVWIFVMVSSTKVAACVEDVAPDSSEPPAVDDFEIDRKVGVPPAPPPMEGLLRLMCVMILDTLLLEIRAQSGFSAGIEPAMIVTFSSITVHIQVAGRFHVVS